MSFLSASLSRFTFRLSWLALLFILVGSVTGTPQALAKTRSKARASSQRTAQQKRSRAPAIPEKIRALGPLSIGHPHGGFLLNAIKMPKSPEWRITVPSHGYGTQETVDSLSHCIRAVHTRFPGSDPVNLGSLSAERGGLLPPHKSHRSGRDADVYFFRKAGTPRWLRAAKQSDIDLPRTWALLRCFITDTDTDMILIDRVPKKWLRDYASSIGESEEWLSYVFDDKKGHKTALVRHVPGHVAHMHVRFVSPKARRVAKKHYDQLVKLGLINLTEKAITHVVKKGDTLSGLGVRFKLKVKKIQELNKLKSSTIRLGQKLTLRKHVDVRGARAPIWVPPRRSAPSSASQSEETRKPHTAKAPTPPGPAPISFNEY